MTCAMTDHAGVRCRQRGIREGVVELVMRHGEATDRGFFLSEKAFEERLGELRRELRLLERAKNIFVAADGNVAITAYKSLQRNDRGRHGGEL